MENAKLTTQLLSIFSGLVRDTEEILELEPMLLESDYEKIANTVKSRGLRVLLVDFPSLCSALEKALESGDMGPLHGQFLVKRGKPSIFAPIFARIFTAEGSLRDEPCKESIRLLRQLLKFAKSYQIACPDEATKEKILEFAEIEQFLVPPRLSWGESDLSCKRGFPTLVDLGFDVQQANGGFRRPGDILDETEDLRVLSRVQDICDGFARHIQWKQKWFNPKHGPGAVSEKFGSSKFEFPSWPERLEAKFPFDLFGLANHAIWDGEIPTSQSVPSKLIGVPKDYKGPRLIASEPICSQFVQQGILSVLRQNVIRSPLRHSLDFRSQEPSRELCIEASATREFSTIDLSSASDRLSCALVECVFRRKYSFLEMLNAARTPTLAMPDGQIMELKKFAPQGAAFTFPLQSIVYTLICMGVISYYTDESRLSVLAKRVRVFGDDMIVPTDHFDAICRILRALQLKVNQDKSFSKGYFRESCGMDAYQGHVVNVVKVLTVFSSRQPSSLVSSVECANNLYKAGLINASRKLLETIPRKKLALIPIVDSASTVFGILGPRANGPTKRRWNKELHRVEQLCLTVESKVRKSTPDGHSHLLQWFLERPRPDVVWVPGEVTSVKSRYRLRWVPSHAVRALG